MAKKSITVRIEERDADALAEIARAERQRTGEPASVSDIVRGAVRAYLDNQEVESEART